MDFYKFLGRIALEFRLSLDNLCKLLNLENNENNKKRVYEEIKRTIGYNPDLLETYDYLFFYETSNQPEKVSKVAYGKAVNYIIQYKKIQELGDSQKLSDKIDELSKTKKDFHALLKRADSGVLTDEDIIIISKYRIRYVISREMFCEAYGIISNGTLREKEKHLTSNSLKYKLKQLSEYQEELVNRRFRRR